MQKLLEILSNKKVKFTVIGVLLFFFIIIMVGTISKNKTKQEENKPEEPKIIEVNEELKNTINKKIMELSYGYYCSIPASVEFSNDCLYRNTSTLKENLNAEYRLSSLITAIGASKDKNVLVGSIVVDNKSFTNPHYVDLKDVKEEYPKLYGKDNFSPEMVNNITKYDIKYDSKREKFVYTIPEETLISTYYLEKLNTTTEEVDAYVRVGYIEYKYYRYNLYSDRELKTEIAKLNSMEYKKGNLINENNVNFFKQYKYTFIKDKETNELLFKQVDLIG